MLGLEGAAYGQGAERANWVDDELVPEPRPPAAALTADALRARRAYVALSRVRGSLVLSFPEQNRAGAGRPSPIYEAVRELGAAEETHEEELFGPAEGLHSTYRMIRDEVLESSWRAGAALSEMRLDTAEDVNRAVARFYELLKLSALIQRPGEESEREALAALNELIGRVATPEQQRELEDSALDSYVVEESKDRARRREHLAREAEPGLEAFLPRRDGGLGLSASDIDLYRTCPLKYKFARVFAIPQEPTINQRFGILVHGVLDRYHSEEMRGFGDEGGDGVGGVDRLLGLFEAGWRRQGFGNSDDELQYRDRAVAALARYYERHNAGGGRPVWLERSFSFKIGEHSIRGRIDRVDRHPGRQPRAHRLQDRRPAQGRGHGRRRPDRALPDRRPRGLGRGGRRRLLLVRARRREGDRRRRGRRPRARRAHCPRGGGGDQRPGLRAQAVVRELLLVRLPADLPRVGGLGAPLLSSDSGFCGQERRNWGSLPARAPKRS